MRLLAFFAALFVLTSSLGASAQTSLPPPEAPDLGTHPDEGLMIAGASVFLLGVTVGLTVLMPLEMSGCYVPGGDTGLPPDHGFAPCGQAPLAGVPFVHLLGGGIDSLIAGPILLVTEVVGLFIFIGGAAHHHPNAAPRAGAITVRGVPGADVGMSVALHF